MKNLDLNELYWDNENLCFTEERINEFKIARVTAYDFITGAVKWLYWQIEKRNINAICESAKTTIDIFNLLEAKVGDKCEVEKIKKEIEKKWLSAKGRVVGRLTEEGLEWEGKMAGTPKEKLEWTYETK